MFWHSFLSAAPETMDALGEALGQLAGALAGRAPDVGIVFLTAHHAAQAQAVARVLVRRWPRVALVGAVTQGVIGGAREREEGPALSLTVGVLPGVEISGFAIPPGDVPEDPADPASWPMLGAVDRDAGPAFVVIADGSTVRADRLVRALDATWPRATIVGGLVAGDAAAGGATLLLGDHTVRHGGVVGFALTGDVEVEPVVAQGARPIGPAFVATRTRQNLVFELDGRPAIPKLEELFVGLSPGERERFRRGPMVGLGPVGGATRPGDFLVRDLVGLDREAGAIGVAWPVETGQTVRFHLRDPAAAADELREMLARHKARPPAGALLFSCLGRGEGFFGEPDHDSRLYREATGSSALGGFFCNGELGPIRGHPYLHGYTSVFALFRPRGWD